jgi:hypothetical protein
MRFERKYIKTKNGTRALMIGRKRKLNVLRDASGVSREHERRQRLDYEARLARRARDLVADGIDPSNAPDRLSGFTLGRLLLRWRADKSDPSGLSQQQYNTAVRLTQIILRHAGLHGYSLNVRSPAFIMLGGQDCTPQPDEARIAQIRAEFTACYDAIMRVCRQHDLGARDLIYGVCVQNWPVGMLAERFGLLRAVLNEVGDALRALDRERGGE